MENAIVVGVGVGRSDEQMGHGFQLGPLAWLSCNLAIIVANSAIEE